MYKATGKPPVVGGLVRNHARIARVVAVTPYSARLGGWLCRARYLGSVARGAWVPTAPGYPPRWPIVRGQAGAGWHPVAAHRPPPGGPQQ